MKKSIGLALVSAVVGLSTPGFASELVEHEISVPGFADFLAVDGDTVWVTNAGRVEQWSTDKLLALTVMPRPCGTMAVGFGSLWVANCTDGTLYRIDLASAEVQTIIATGIANPKGETNVVIGAGSVWVPSDGAGKVARVDPETNEVIASISVDPGTFYLSYGFDAVWAASSDEQSLQKIAPETNTVTDKISLGKQPGFLVAGEGAVWVQEQGDGTVVRVDPDSVEVTGRAKVGENLIYGDIDAGGGKIWLRTTDDQTFAVIDPQSMEVLTRAGKPVGSGAIRYTPSRIWTSAHDVLSISWWTEDADEN